MVVKVITLLDRAMKLAEDISVSSYNSASAAVVSKLETRQEEKKPTRSARFDLSCNVEHRNTVYCQEDLLEMNLWYSESEFRRFKESNKLLAKGIYMSERKGKSEAMPYSFSCAMERAYNRCCEASSQSQPEPKLTTLELHELGQWAELCPNRIGIEKWAVRTIVNDKYARRDELIDIILYIQEENSLTADEQQEYIRECCETISRPSRMMAHLVANARSQSLGKKQTILPE